MNTKLLIVTDLGLLRAYREVQGPHDRKSHLELIEEIEPKTAHMKLSDQVTDRAGRFPRGRGAGKIPGDLSAGERLSVQTEATRRLVTRMADRINELLSDDTVTSCCLASTAAIRRQLLARLDPKARAKISQVLVSDLAKTEAAELLMHFGNPPRLGL